MAVNVKVKDEFTGKLEISVHRIVMGAPMQRSRTALLFQAKVSITQRLQNGDIAAFDESSMRTMREEAEKRVPLAQTCSVTA
jgi:hypothetical protein